MKDFVGQLVLGKTSTNSEIFTVQELNPLQIGLSGGKELKSLKILGNP